MLNHPPDTHFVDQLRYWAAERPAAIAFYYTSGEQDEASITYEQLDRKARAIASRLLSMDAKGARAVLLYPPGLDFVAALYGCFYAGTVAVPTNPPRRNKASPRLDAICNDANASLVLSVKLLADQAVHSLPETSPLAALPWITTDEVLDAEGDSLCSSSPEPRELALLQYTSGATGTPKGVMLTHSNLIASSVILKRALNADPSGMGLLWVPTFHDMGLVAGVLQPIFSGCPHVMMPPMAFLQKPVRWLTCISRYRVTISGAPNFAYALCTERISDAQMSGLDLSSWKLAANGGESIRPETLEAFTRKFGPYGFRAETHYPSYGLAETTLLVAGGLIGKPPVSRSFDRERLENNEAISSRESTGERIRLVGFDQLFTGTEILIVDPESHHKLPSGRVGEIWIRGPSVGTGYWNRPDETRNIFTAQLADNGLSGGGGSNVLAASNPEPNYLRTGDVGFYYDHKLFVTGRSKELINVRGRNLYPQDVEFTASKADRSLQAGAAVAFSVENDGQEKIVIAQELRRRYQDTDLDVVMRAIRRRVAEEHSVSVHAVLLLKAGRLPRTSSGKVQRMLCKSKFEKGVLDATARWISPPNSGRLRTVVSQSIKRPGQSEVRNWLLQRIASLTNQPAEEIGAGATFHQLGLDSLGLVTICHDLETWLQETIEPTLLYSHPTIDALTRYLADGTLADHRGDSYFRTEKIGNSLREPVAIIGLGCRFPGASSPDDFWTLLRGGINRVIRLPEKRYGHESMDALPDIDRNMATRGGFLDQVDQFDAQFFRISPREAINMDPQQRLLLEVAWETLESAGQAPDDLQAKRTGIFVGISNCDYSRLTARQMDPAAVDAYAATGTAASLAAGRLAHFLGFDGPCMAVDTACSSSLVAVNQAVESIRQGRCRAALAGGVNLILDSATSIALARLGSLSPTGTCKTFDAAADGYVRGEGCGLVLLKPLSAALEDGDPILAVIRGTALNHDGFSNGLTAPNGRAQEMLLREATVDAGIHPCDISYVEAHGTGTRLGDPIEIRALTAVLCADRPHHQPLVIGSVKTNIGHLESAAGVAGLIKVVLSLVHREIPPHLHFKNANPHIPWDEFPVVVPTRAREWRQLRGRRLAGISSFGFSGTNAHVVVEEAPKQAETKYGPETCEQLLVLSARNESTLRQLADRYHHYLANEAPSFGDICYTAATGRYHFRHRLAICAREKSEAQRHLAAVGDGLPAPALKLSANRRQEPPRLAFLFAGQGSEYAGMGRALYDAQPVFRQTMDKCDEILRGVLKKPLLSVIYSASEASQLLHETLYAQPALFAVQCALLELWKSWGVHPQFVIGHSLGEFVAACAAGMLQLEDGLRLVTERGRLMQNLTRRGRMFAVEAEEARVQHTVRSSGREDISIAAVNGPTQTVVSGEAEAVAEVVAALQSDGILARELRVANAFHSSLLEPILDEFENFCSQVSFSEPRIPLISNLHGCEASEQMATAEYWRRQARETVRFHEGMRSLASLGANVFLEASPQPIFAATDSLLARDQLWTYSLREGHDDSSQMLRGLSQLYVRGVDVDWRGVHRDRTRRKVLLPTYPFERESFWLREEASTAPRLATDRLTLASKEAGSAPVGAHWFYQLRWRPRSRLDQALPSRLRPDLPLPKEIAERVSVEVDRLQAQGQLPRYRDLQRELDTLCSAYVVHALVELGWWAQPGANFGTETLANQLGISTQYRRLLARMLGFLEEDGLLRRTDRKGDSCWQVVKPIDKPPDVAQTAAYLARQYDECRAELRLLKRCGSELAGILSGQTEALQLLFPDGSLDLVAAIYRDSPFARASNSLVAAVVARVMETRPLNQPLKILEIGGGTGGASAEIISKLSATPAEYIFTDISDRFTSAARHRFGASPYVSYAMLDIERSPAEQGFAAGQFDLIIAANVVHATRDLRQTLHHIRDLAAPGGLFVLLEAMKATRWLDLTFGLTDGWWRFTDTQVRSDHPLVGARTWTDLLGSCGFMDTQVLPAWEEAQEQTQAPQAVVVSRKAVALPATDPRKTAEWSPSARDTWIVLADSTGVAEQLVRRLEASGGRCVTARVGREFKREGNRRFLVEPSQPESMKQFLAAALEAPRANYRGVIHLWSLDTATADCLDVEEIHRAECLTCESVRQLLQGLGADNHRVAGLWLVTRGAQSVDDEQALPGLIQAPLWGMGRAIADEVPTMRTALVDLDPQLLPDEIAIVLETEILNPDAEVQIAFRGSQRYAPRLCEGAGAENRIASPPIPAHQSTHTLAIKTDATYLITGGTGDLGLLVAEWLIKQGARHLVLTGRRDFPPRAGRQQSTLDGQRLQQVVATIEDLEATGARVLTTRCDAADRDQIDDLLVKLFNDGWPALRGVIHAAGVVSPCGLLDLGREQLTEVLRPKVLGTWNLHRALIEHQLDFFVMFSSGASLIGSPLLGSYAAANAFLDAIAHHRRATGHSSLTINWGFWENLGMVRRGSQVTGTTLVPKGMFSFTAEQGLRALESLLASDDVQMAIMPADWSMWSQCHPHSAYSPLLAELTSPELQTDRVARSDLTATDLREVLLSMEPPERGRKIAELVTDQLSRSLRLSAHRIDPNQSLNQMGIDSLMAVEIRNRLVNQLGIDIPIGQLLSDPSVNELAEIVARNLASNLTPVPALPVQTDLETHGEDTATSSR